MEIRVGRITMKSYKRRVVDTAEYLNARSNNVPEIKYNNFDGLNNTDSLLSFFYEQGGDNYTTLSAMEIGLTSTYASNNQETAIFGQVENAFTDFHYIASPPNTNLTEGGYDLSSIFTTDGDGTTRTVPWSVGPYEKDLYLNYKGPFI